MIGFFLPGNSRLETCVPLSPHLRGLEQTSHLPSRPRWAPRLLMGLIFAMPVPTHAALSTLPWTPAETVARLGPLLDTGEVIWLECGAKGEFQQATVFGRIPTSADKAFHLMKVPQNYKRMSPTVDSVEVNEQDGSSTVYTTRIRIPFGSLTNVVRMDLFPPHRIDTRFVGGDLQTGTFRWQFVPDSSTRSTAIYSIKTDVRETNWMVKQMTKVRPETQHGGNSGTGLITVWGLRRMLESPPPDGQAIAVPPREASPWEKRPVELPIRLENSPIHWASLLPMLQRGPLIQVESTPGGRLKRVTAYGRVDALPQALYAVASTPENYPRITSHIQSVELLEKSSSRLKFVSEIELMKLRYRQTEELTLHPTRITQRTLDGDLEGAAWQLEVAPLGGGDIGASDTLAAYSFYSDPSRNGWIMKQVFALDPLVEHIFAVSGGFGSLMGLSRAAENKPPLFAENEASKPSASGQATTPAGKSKAPGTEGKQP